MLHSKLMLKAALLLSFLSLSLVFAQRDLLTTPEGREVVFNALVDTLAENYWDASYRDWSVWAEDFREDAISATTRGSFERVARRMVRELDDQHSSWIGLTVQIDENTELPESPGRRGLGFEWDFLRGSGVVLERVFAGTPAEEAGLRRGDVVIAIGNRDITELNRSSASGIFASSVDDDEITFTVRRKLEILDVIVMPDVVRFEEASDTPRGYMLDDSTGFIYLPTFNNSDVGEQIHRLILDLQAQGATSLIVDLRDNLGGQLGQLGLVLGAFVDGPWAQAISRGELAWESSFQVRNARGFNTLTSLEGDTISEARLDEVANFTGPLALIVSDQNSSAGEIMPLVLQNLGRANVVGQATEGNVEAIRGFDLPDDSVVLVAVANLQAIDGSSFDAGVQPDVEVIASLEELARGYDAPVAEALRLLKDLPFTPGKFF